MWECVKYTSTRLTYFLVPADEERAGAAGRFKLDFSGLKRQLTTVRSEADREALHADFRREIDARVASLAHVAPNLKALEQFQAVKVRPCR